jgi:hypothetical protein
MMSIRTILMLGLLSAGIITSSVQSVVEVSPNIPIKWTQTKGVTHYAQYDDCSGITLFASYNENTKVYTAGFSTEFGPALYADRYARKLFMQLHKQANSIILD